MDGMIFWTPGVTLEDLERTVILKAYSFYHKNKTATAQALGIAIRTLDSKLEKYEDDRIKQEEREAAGRKQREEFLAAQRGPHQSYNAPEGILTGSLSSPPAGVRVESLEKVGTERPVSVQKPQEVQKVLPSKASASGSGSRR